MAAIVNAYDLSTYVPANGYLSTAVTTPNNVRFHFVVEGATDENQVVKLTLKVTDDTNYVNLTDTDGRAIHFYIKGNREFSRNIIGINSGSLKVKVEPDGDGDGVADNECTGTLTINTYES